MSRSPIARPVWPPPSSPSGKTPPARAVQRAGAEAVLAPHARTLRTAPPPRALPEELLARPGGGYQLRSAERRTLSPPTGTFNFVRVYGEAPRSRPLLVSTKLAHAQLAAGRPVVYAGTARFEQGEMAWWSNFSGTYQPIAAFRRQAGLPDDKFVPWQKLQLGGTAMQRGVFSERRPAGPPASPSAAGDAVGRGKQARAEAAGGGAAASVGQAARPGPSIGSGQPAKSGSAGGGS